MNNDMENAEIGATQDINNEPEQTSEDDIEQLEKIALEPTLEEQLDEMKNQWMRAVAETENVRRRAQRDRDESVRYAPLNFARDIVSVCDNLRRASEAAANEDRTAMSQNTQALITGVEYIVQELDKVLVTHNIKRITPMHEKFDPHFHQAMAEVESEEYPHGVVIHVMQDGYALHDRLLRPAMVCVSKGKAVAE